MRADVSWDNLHLLELFSPNGPRRDFAGVPVLIIEDKTIIPTDIAFTLNDLGYETVGLGAGRTTKRSHSESEQSPA